jgi:hypothetical protein
MIIPINCHIIMFNHVLVKNFPENTNKYLPSLVSLCAAHSDYRTVSHYWVLLVYVALIRAVWAFSFTKIFMSE